jgi:hypothetical protein
MWFVKPLMGIHPRKQRLLVVIAITAIGILIGVLGVRMHEKKIEGRTVQSWLWDVVHGQGRDRVAAVEMFARNGAKTVPELIPIIEWRSSSFIPESGVKMKVEVDFLAVFTGVLFTFMFSSLA